MQYIVRFLLLAIFCALSVWLLEADGGPVRISSAAAKVPEESKLSILRNTHTVPAKEPVLPSAYCPSVGSQDVSLGSLQGHQRLSFPMMIVVASGLLRDRNDSLPEPLNLSHPSLLFSALFHSGLAPPPSSRLTASFPVA